MPEVPEEGEDEILTPYELSEVLAEATGTTPEAIERGAEKFWIEDPETADWEYIDE